jgi:hypothetical protein
VICLLLVLVPVGLVALFLWDVRKPQAANPFTVDPQLLSDAARPPEVVAAGYLLPNTQAARRHAPPTPLSPADLSPKDASLAATTANYRPKRTMAADYEVAGATLSALAVETDGPEWAFGLWSARRPAEAKMLNASGNTQAWRTDSSAAFWSGRHYVELSVATPPAPSTAPAPDISDNAAPPADPLAILLAEVSRAYVPFGRPFPAEAVLPADGLKADSLRFTAEPAFGIEPLKPAFLADYESGAQLAIIALNSPHAAEAALKGASKGLSQADPEDPEAESAGQAAPPIDAKGRASGSLADGRTILLQAVDRFLVAAVSPQAEQASALLDQVPEEAPAQALAAASAGPGASAEGPLPKLQEADLSGPGEVRRFNTDTLYEKINGKAQLYQSYNFAELLFTTYTAGEASLDVYVYDMGQADNAFGIYKAEEGEDAEAVEIGAGGYASGASVFFWKGKYYINILAGGEEPGHASEGGGSDAHKAVAMKLASAIADQIKSAGQSLWAEQVLPQADRVAGSFEFRKSDAFGLDFLKDVFSAQYKVVDQDLTLFVMREASPDKAEDVLKQYEAFGAKYGKVLETADTAGAKVMLVESSGTYDVVFRKDRYFGGATAAGDKDAAKAMVTKWVQDLK